MIFENDNWEEGANASQIPENLKPRHPRDAAVLVTLAPGVAIVEVFVQ